MIHATCLDLPFVLPADYEPSPLIKLTIHRDGDVPVRIVGFSSVAEALTHGMEWKNRLWCSVSLDGVEVASEYPMAKLNPPDQECTAYKHVIPKVVP